MARVHGVIMYVAMHHQDIEVCCYCVLTHVVNRVNKYPIQRSFTGIGSGGEEFKAALLLCVESVVGPVHIECVSERKSSKGSYQSITVSLN